MAANKERAEREAKKLADEHAAKLAAALRKPPTTTQGSQTETGDAAAIRETNNMILEDLYCLVDDFCKTFMPEWHASLIENQIRQKPWSCQMSPSEIMLIMILFHQQQYRNFKTFYLMHVQKYMSKYFPNFHTLLQ